MDARFSKDLDEHDDQNSAKKTLILIARFWARKSRLQKTAKNQEIQKDKCCKYQHFGVRD